MKKALFRELIYAEYGTTQTRNHLSVRCSLYEYNGDPNGIRTRECRLERAMS